MRASASASRATSARDPSAFTDDEIGSRTSAETSVKTARLSVTNSVAGSSEAHTRGVKKATCGVHSATISRPNRSTLKRSALGGGAMPCGACASASASALVKLATLVLAVSVMVLEASLVVVV
eukprot:5607046-Pleurochrysis_carterae.AAC.1